jgi:hypothetical protein
VFGWLREHPAIVNAVKMMMTLDATPMRPMALTPKKPEQLNYGLKLPSFS